MKFLITHITVNTHTPQTYVGTRASMRHVGTLGSCPAGPSLGLALVGRVTASFFLLRWAVTVLGLHEVSFSKDCSTHQNIAIKKQLQITDTVQNSKCEAQF